MLVFLLCWQVNVQAQGTCATAVTLTPGTQQCGDTADGGDTFDDNTCLGSYDGGDDYLFVVTVPAANDGNTLELTLTSSGSWTGIAISEGCPEGGGGVCFGASTSSSGNENLTSNPLTGGNTYYIHISTWPSPQSATFCLDAVYAGPAAPPANDDCGGAIPLTVNPDEACGTVTPGTIEGATASPEDPSACSGTEDDDVWFTFVATSTVHSIALQNISGSTTDLYHSLWEGTCGGLTHQGLCSDPNISTATSLTIGATYYLRVYTWTSTIGQTTDFDVCIGTPVPPPANNDCAGAIDYDTAFGAVGAAGTCPGNTVSLDISAYTDNGEDPSCDFGSDATTWYTWTANTTEVLFTSGTGGPGIEILDGTCGSFTSLGCLNNVNGSITGLTIGTTYYVIIWDDGLVGTTLEWCLEAVPPPPANDACANAISVAAGAATATGSTISATDVEGLSPCSGGGTCGGGTGGIDWGAGVWFVYTSTVAEDITIDTEGSSFDTEIQVFEGTCGALVCVGGDDDSGNTPTNSSLICFSSSASAAAPPGTAAASAPVDYYIYVDGHGANTGNFVLNIGAAPLPVTLISFKGEKMDNANKLSWVTAVEENTEMHILERSVDGNRWSTVGKVEAQGFSYENKSYELLDKDPLAKSFYRLKSLDFDGTFQYSEVISLERASEGFSLTSVFPVPSKGELSVEFNSKDNDNVNVMITDMVGRVVFQDQFDAADGTNLYNTDIADFAQGVYFISLNNGRETLTQRIIKN